MDFLFRKNREGFVGFSRKKCEKINRIRRFAIELEPKKWYIKMRSQDIILNRQRDAGFGRLCELLLGDKKKI